MLRYARVAPTTGSERQYVALYVDVMAEAWVAIPLSMVATVLRLAQDHEVGRVVVDLVLILVMDVLIITKMATKDLLND